MNNEYDEEDEEERRMTMEEMERDDKFETYKPADVEIEESNPIKSTGGFLNSVLRHLPLQTKTLGRKAHRLNKRPGSSYAPSSQGKYSEGKSPFGVLISIFNRRFFGWIHSHLLFNKRL